MSALFQDIRVSLRLLARNPVFTAVAVLTLAVALGASTAAFSVIDGVLLRALPYPEPDRIVDVSIGLPPAGGRAGGQPGRKAFLDSQALADWQRSARTVERLAAYSTRSFTLRGAERTERLTGASVSPALFPLLGVAPAHGRAFREEEGRPGADRVVLLSHGLWRRRFQGDPEIVGRTVTLDGAPSAVVGVMPAGFSFPHPEVELWVPLAPEPPAAPGADALAAQYAPAIARLRDGVSLEQAAAEAQAFLARPGEGGPGPEDAAPPGKVRLVPLRDEMVAEVEPALLALSAAVGLVLLIAALDLAGLLLVRNASRQREMAIRSAVGGGRARLVRQMLTESTVLCLAGGAAGMLVALAIHRLLPPLLPRDIPRLEEVRLDLRVFLFAFLLAAATGLATGLLPALRSARASLALPLQGGTAGPSPGRSYRGLPVVAEVALAFVLLAGAGLLLRSVRHLAGLELGYEPDRVLAAAIELDPVRYGGAERGVAFLDELLGRVETHPGVEAAGVVSFAPLSPGFSLASLGIVGEPPGPTLAVPQMTSPGYLRAMGLHLARGRWLTREDLASEASVAVVNETFARQYLPGREVLGRRLAVGSATLEIVGVLADVRLLGLESAAKPELFTSYRQAKAVSGGIPGRLTLAVRTAGDPAALQPSLRALVHELDPDLALGEVEPMRAKLAASVAQPRFYALLLALFAATALALAAAGLYGVLSYAVARQTRAIGVRRALGAGRRDILAMVLGRGLALISTGLAIGLAAAASVTRVLAHFLSGVTARDPLSYLLASLALLGAGVLACYLPARRAALVDPVEALRQER